MKLLINKLIPFFLLLFVVISCTKLGRQAPGKLEEQNKVIEILNEKFDLSKKPRTIYQVTKGIEFDCPFKFRVGIEDDKITLIARFCESTSEYTKEQKLAEVLTLENAILINNPGFEQIKLYDRFEDKFIDSATIESIEQ